ncbi:MAG: lysozyme [Candidatus Methanosuratincola sp.]
MLTSPLAIKLIKHFEGLRLKPYLCPAGYTTIGYGHVLSSGESIQSLTEAEAEALLLTDITRAERAVLRLITVPLTPSQFDSLVDFVFNLGAGALQRSTLRQKINRQEHEDVPNEFLRWVYAGGKRLNGLVKRRTFDALLYQGLTDVVEHLLS